MDNYTILPSGARIEGNSRSMGVKLIVVCGLALAMTIPGFFVGGLVEERTQRAAEVIRQISGYSGGEQTFLGPTLAIPYRIPAQPGESAPRRGVYLVFPAAASGVLKTVTEERRRSLFKVPVYQADLKLDAEFDLTGAPTAVPPGAELDWNRAEIVAGVSDSRGALADATMTVDAKTATLVPAEGIPEIVIGGDETGRLKLALLGTKLDALAKPNTRFHLTSSLRFSGARRVAILAYGKTTHLSVQGDWPNPGFDGGFLPARRTVTRSGFTADWSVPYIARGVRAEGPADSIAGLEGTALGTSFVEVADPYQSVSRSVKYALLFTCLLFLTYFVFEVSSARRVHPAQYILVGIAQIIFYLLLLSLAERIGFDWSFLIAGAATVALLSANAGWVFSSRIEALRALAAFTLLYGSIYLLLRAEDNALLVGAVASFLAVASAMYLTRKIDWYSPFPATGAAPRPSEPAGPEGAA